MGSQKTVLAQALTRSAIRALPARRAADFPGGATPSESSTVEITLNPMLKVGTPRLYLLTHRGNNCPAPGWLLYFVVNVSRRAAIASALLVGDLRVLFQRVAGHLLPSVSG